MQFWDRYHKVIGSASFGIVVGALLMSQIGAVIDVSRNTSLEKKSPIDQLTVDTTFFDASEPIRLSIPDSEILAEFEEPLGVNVSSEIEVPDSYDTVGWYKYGPTPGEIGPSVILGHYDSYKGPAIFFKLKEVKENDLIYIDREDGSKLTFEVTKTENVAQGDFPTERVYGDIEYAGLRLVTCSGYYDRGSLRYSQNLIVYARLVPADT